MRNTFNRSNLPLGFYYKKNYMYSSFLIEQHIHNTISAKSNEFNEKRALAKRFPIVVDDCFESATELENKKSFDVKYYCNTSNIVRRVKAIGSWYMKNDLRFDTISYNSESGEIIVKNTRFEF